MRLAAQHVGAAAHGDEEPAKGAQLPPRSAAPQMTGRACTYLLPSRNPVELRNACRALERGVLLILAGGVGVRATAT